MKKVLVYVLSSLMVLSLLTACSGGGETPPPIAEDNTAAPTPADSGVTDTAPDTVVAPGEKMKVAVIIKNRGDMSFWDSIASGGDRAAIDFADRAEVVVIEAADITENLTAMYEQADAGANMIISAADYRDNMTEIANEYPDLAMVAISEPNVVAAGKEANNNIYGFDFLTCEASFLAGIAAADRAAQDGSGTVGFVGGMDESLAIQEFLVGYIQGAKYVNPDIDVKYIYVGGWNDPDKAKTQAEAIYNDSGAAVIFACAGGSGTGVHDAAANTGKFVIGVDSDQSLLYTDKPETRERFLTSVLKKCDNAVYNTIQQYLDTGTLPFGEMEILGVAADAVGIVENDLFEKYVSADGKAKLQEAKDAISNGSLTVWSAINKEQDEIKAKIAELIG